MNRSYPLNHSITMQIKAQLLKISKLKNTRKESNSLQVDHKSIMTRWRVDILLEVLKVCFSFFKRLFAVDLYCTLLCPTSNDITPINTENSDRRLNSWLIFEARNLCQTVNEGLCSKPTGIVPVLSLVILVHSIWSWWHYISWLGRATSRSF